MGRFSSRLFIDERCARLAECPSKSGQAPNWPAYFRACVSQDRSPNQSQTKKVCRLGNGVKLGPELGIVRGIQVLPGRVEAGEPGGVSLAVAVLVILKIDALAAVTFEVYHCGITSCRRERQVDIIHQNIPAQCRPTQLSGEQRGTGWAGVGVPTNDFEEHVGRPSSWREGELPTCQRAVCRGQKALRHFEVALSNVSVPIRISIEHGGRCVGIKSEAKAKGRQMDGARRGLKSWLRERQPRADDVGPFSFHKLCRRDDLASVDKVHLRTRSTPGQLCISPHTFGRAKETSEGEKRGHKSPNVANTAAVVKGHRPAKKHRRARTDGRPVRTPAWVRRR
jgi:hypothetical protein